MAVSRQLHRFDHDAARAFYVSLDPPRRYVDVAAKFGVSDTTIRKVARAEAWQDAAFKADEQAAEKALAGAVRTREQRVKAVLAITDRLVDHFIAEAAAKAAASSYLDLERMMKLAELVEGEATDRFSFAEVQSTLVVVMAAGPELLAELAAAGLKGRALERAFKERFPQVVRERVALNSGGGR